VNEDDRWIRSYVHGFLVIIHERREEKNFDPINEEQ